MWIFSWFIYDFFISLNSNFLSFHCQKIWKLLPEKGNTLKYLLKDIIRQIQIKIERLRFASYFTLLSFSVSLGWLILTVIIVSPLRGIGERWDVSWGGGLMVYCTLGVHLTEKKLVPGGAHLGGKTHDKEVQFPPGLRVTVWLHQQMLGYKTGNSTPGSWIHKPGHTCVLIQDIREACIISRNTLLAF